MATIEEVHMVEAATPDVLEEIRTPGVNLSIWHREPVPVPGELLRQPLRFDGEAPEAAELVRAIPELGPMAADIVRLWKRFGQIAGTRHPRVRLERVDDDGCALFHADSLRVRMLCTYAGAGTEWLDNDDVNWDELGLRGRTLDEANAAIVRSPECIRRIPTGAVAVFSGRGREEARPLIHRSAPIRPGEGFRLRLCIDLPGNCGC